MKVALICTEKLPVPPILGGAIQIYIDSVLPVLARHHEVTLFSLHNNKLPSRENLGNIRHIRIMGKTADEYINNLKRTILEEAEEYDLIHIFNRPLWVLRFSDVFPSSAFSLSLHNEMFSSKKIDPERALQCLDKVRFITAVSHFIAGGLIEKYPDYKEKISVVYSAADASVFKPVWSEDVREERTALRKSYGLDNHKVVLFVGRLSHKKGVHILLEAMEKVMEVHPEAALVLVGSKWYGINYTDEYIGKLQEIGKKLKGPVVFTGFLTPQEIYKYYSMGDIFVCASQWREPLARVHYEAMAAGLPIISTARGGNAEVMQQMINGIVIEEYNNPEVMANCINFLLEHEEEALKMGKAGREMVVQKYNWERVGKQLLDLMAKV